MGRYLVAADPSQDEVDRIWGISTLVTTQLTPGVGVLLDSTKFGRMAVREPLSVRVGFANDDLVRNIYRWVCEERLALAVERPSAILSITKLPVS